MKSRDLLKEKLTRLSVQMKILPRTFALILTGVGSWIWLWSGLLLVRGILPAAAVYLTKLIVDVLAAGPAEAATGGGENLWVLIAGLGVVLLLIEFTRAAGRIVDQILSERLREDVTGQVYRKSISIDLAHYDTPSFYDQFYRAQAEAESRPMELLHSLGSIFRCSVTLIGMFVLLFTLSSWLPFVLTLSLLPAAAVAVRSVLAEHALRLQFTEKERWGRYYEWLMRSKETAVEIRVFGIGEHFLKLYREISAYLRRERVRFQISKGTFEFLAYLFSFALLMGVLVYAALNIQKGSTSLGDLVLLFQAFQSGQSLFRELLQEVVALYGHSLFLSDMFSFLELEPQIISPAASKGLPRPVRAGISLKDVRFRYPGSQGNVLHGVNLTIPAGSTVALLGENGAGKSTLAKLICRLYEAASGSVTFDDTDVRDISLEELRKQVVLLDQEPACYSATLSESMMYGELGAEDHERLQQVVDALSLEGIIKKLPEGLNTLLGSWFSGGHELSVGEWHRVGLARALYRNAEVIILDEPTSAMDPWTEKVFLSQLRELTQGKTVILITHRVSTARIADSIFVIHEGRVVDTQRGADFVLPESYAAGQKG